MNIAPPHVDGGTTLSLKARVSTWTRELRELVEASGPLPATIRLTGPDGTTITGAVLRNGDRGISIIFEGEAQLDLYPWSAHVNLIAKAEALWTTDMDEWLTTWLSRATRWLLDADCPSPADAHALGWKVSKFELAADFTGLSFYDGEATLFTGRRRKKGGRIDSGDFKFDGTVETINVQARRRHGLALSTHDKTQKLIEDKVVPDQSVYAPTWTANCWDGSARVRRVEVRASGRALILRSDDGELLDLTDPLMLLDPTALGTFWRHTTHRLRLAQRPATLTASFRARSAPVDARWLAVQKAGSIDETRWFRVARPRARQLAFAELVARTRRDVERGLAQLASRLALAPAALTEHVHELVKGLIGGDDTRPSVHAERTDGP